MKKILFISVNEADETDKSIEKDSNNDENSIENAREY
jgi:hypothetical protein